MGRQARGRAVDVDLAAVRGYRTAGQGDGVGTESPHPAALTILRALTPLGEDPRRPDANVKKLSGYDDRYRLRVGDYRVIYEVVDGQLVILVVGVGHRREICRAMS